MNSRLCILMFAILTVITGTVQSQNVNIIPQPNYIKVADNGFEINRNVQIISLPQSKKTAEYFQSILDQSHGYKLELIESKKIRKGQIQFILNSNLGKEAYELNVSKSGIQVVASNNTGWFYGVQSLLQLLPTKIPLLVPGVEIKDAPRFSWRAFMLDESRYFKGIEQVKLLLDEMAHLKMNVFHWHLTDDQGWRLEIKKYPKLTEIGSKRKSTQVGPLKWASPIQSAEPHEGFYTQEQVRMVLKYAEDRHIQVVPEIEMPGHSSAAIAAYSWLGTKKQKTEVPIKFGVGTDVYDVSDQKVYQFLTDVLDEVIALFPSNVIHIGGDEVKYNHWKNSKPVQAYMKNNGLASPADLQIYFTNSISNYLQGKGRRMMGWNEIMGHNLHEYQDESDTKASQQLAKETVVHFWKGDVKLASQAASSGFDIVNSLHSNTYLDYDYNSIPLSKAYKFDPIPEGLDPKFHGKVIGTGCQMWGEWIPTDGHMHFQVFPRIAAYAEVGWTTLPNKNFEDFKAALEPLKLRWKQRDIYFAPDDAVERKSK